MPHTPPPLASDPTKNNVITYRTAVFASNAINGGTNTRYTRLNYDRVFLGYRTPDETRNFLQLRLNSARVSARERIFGGINDLTATTLIPDWIDDFDEVVVIDESEAVQFARIAYTNR